MSVLGFFSETDIFIGNWNILQRFSNRKRAYGLLLAEEEYNLSDNLEDNLSV